MRAVQMLVRASNQGLIDPRSVSMIILVSDGDPTVGKTVQIDQPIWVLPSKQLLIINTLLCLVFVGEIKLSTIQKNVKRVMREEFSLFSLGIGFDVDYDFLERIAMENRGMAQRIYANHDAAEQLRVQNLSFSKQLTRLSSKLNQKPEAALCPMWRWNSSMHHMPVLLHIMEKCLIFRWNILN